ncbi:MAG: tail protein X [Opitutaceae bacterium]|jgi:phage tail protein X/uncharacterized phage infection (PIP) family protein YhgE
MNQRLARLCVLSLAMLLMSGCAYIHIGRLQKRDPVLAAENADLRLERKILQQELVLARKEGEALHSALEAKAGGAGDKELAEKLADATSELAQLRAGYAALKKEASSRSHASGEASDLITRLSATEEKLALALHDFTELQKETAELKDQLQSQKRENKIMADKVQEMTAETEQARTALSQLNTELLAQKEARSRAEQATESLRAQLSAVMKQERSDIPPAKLSDLRETTASSATSIENSGIHVEGVPTSDAPPTAMLAVTRAKVGAASDQPDKPAAAEDTSAQAKDSTQRIHVVKEGDTLEAIARKYYGRVERWRWIYAANNALLREGRPLHAGMQLVIPEDSELEP